MMEAVVIWIFVASFLDLFAVSLLLPLMSAHLKKLGASHFIMGCMTSVYAFSQLVSGPIIGSWSDRIGRHTILVFSLLAVSCCYIILGLLNSLILILLLRAVIGVLKHVQVLIHAVIIDRVSSQQQALVFANLKAVAGISFTLGPAIGGILAEIENGFCYICYCVGALFLLNCAVAYFFLQDSSISKIAETPNREGEKCNRKTGASIMVAIRDLADIDWPIYWDVFALKFLIDFSAVAFHNNYTIRIQEKFDVSQKVAGYMISFQSFVGVLTGFIIDSMNERFYKNDFSYKNRNLHGFAVMALAYLSIAMTQSLSIFMMWSMLLKSSHMFLRIVLTEMVIRRCVPNQKGSLIGTGNSISNAAHLVTPLLTGFVEDKYGSNSANVLAATAAIVAVALSYRLHERHYKVS